MTNLAPVVLKPDYSATRRFNPITFVRAAVVALHAGNERGFDEDVVARLYPHDRDVGLLTRAATSPATLTNTSALTATGAAQFFGALSGSVAGAAVLASGPQFEYGNHAAVNVVSLLDSASTAGFVPEGSPIPVRQLSVADQSLAPRKFAALAVFSREIFRLSQPNIEAVVQSVLTDSVGLALDAALFDANAGDGSRPPGLRFGIAAAGTASALTTAEERIRADLKTLISGVASVAGNGPVILIASPAQAVTLRLWPNMPYRVFSSSALVNGDVIAIAPNALVSSLDSIPRFESGDQASLHMDSAPTALSTVGSPNQTAAPIRSLWQTDSIGLRVIFNASWVLRSAAGLSWLTNVGW